jgi:hypothetical protein
MKRQASSPGIAPSPEHKRPKTLEETSTGPPENDWVKVEKRKNKKARKVEARVEVCDTFVRSFARVRLRKSIAEQPTEVHVFQCRDTET